MDAVVFDPVRKELNFTRKAPPGKPSGSEVLIRVAFAGICGTDLHISEGEFPCSSSEFIPGHELSGVVEAVGPEVTHVKPRDRVTVDPSKGCYTCSSCTSGKCNLCIGGGINNTVGVFKDGGWAEFCSVFISQVYKIPEGVSLEQAALTEPISCLAHGLNRIGPVTVGQNILTRTGGWNNWEPLGGCFLSSRSQKSNRVGTERVPEGTSYKCVDPSELKDFQADLIVDCSGSPRALESALDLLSPGGKLCVFGVAPPDSKMSVSPYEIFRRELIVLGVMIQRYAFPAALGLVEAMGSRYLDYDRLGVKVFALKDFKTALENLKSRKIAKAVFRIANCRT